MVGLYTFREPSLGRQVHRELMRRALLDLPSIIPATACHQRNYVERYSRFSVGALLCSFGVFWGAEGLGEVWPWDATTLVGILAVVLVVSWGSVHMVQRMLPHGAHIAARNV